MGASVAVTAGLKVLLSMAVATSPSRLTGSPGPLTPYTAFELMISPEGGDPRQWDCAAGTLGPWAAALHRTVGKQLLGVQCLKRIEQSSRETAGRLGAGPAGKVCSVSREGPAKGW